MSRQNKKVDDFRLDLVDDRTHKQLWCIRFSRVGFIVSAVASVVFIIFVFFALFAFTPLRRAIPGYPDESSKRAAIQNAIRADSLEKIISRWELYSENLRRVIEGEDPVRIDSIMRSGNAGYAKTREELQKRDSLLRENVRNEEQFGLSNSGHRNLPIEGKHFFTPLKGVISQDYDKVIHPFIDITAPANSVVAAVLDGTVISAGWSDDVGYTICIQHENDIVSIYKHNNKLLKSTGEKVTAGTPVALVGGTGSISTGEHLHFELWYRGEPVDPTKYINF